MPFWVAGAPAGAGAGGAPWRSCFHQSLGWAGAAGLVVVGATAERVSDLVVEVVGSTDMGTLVPTEPPAGTGG